jgi:beta-galactosidase
MKQVVKKIVEGIRFGVDYYPEHWPQSRWETDAKLMQEMGISVVRMAEFSWHKMEPSFNQFDFVWLDEAILLLRKYGIYTILGTPTAAPPAWIIEKTPEILPIDSQGQQKSFGGRHHDCQSNPTYRQHIKRFVTKMAEHFKDNPNVIGWQIDNELGNSHDDLCMCDSCRQSFQNWLSQKYQTITRLNQEWGTCFWSQDYDNFSQIPVPKQTPTVHNPSLLLDFKRFCSDLVIDFHKMQVDIIRHIAPHQQITHNLMGFYDKTDYFKMAADLDFASNDQYPTGYYFDVPQPAYEVAACMDFIRGVKKKNFWMMEMESGPTGGGIIGVTPRPGQNMLWTALSVAHGADAIVYFRWRTCLFGAEQFWHGILPHHGVPGRRYREIQDAIRRLAPVMDDIHGIVTKAKVGILFSYEQEWAIRLQPQHPKLTYSGLVLKYYQQFFKRNIPVDFISVQDDFTDYPVLVAPLLYLMTPEIEDKLFTYVKNGGTLVLTMRTGVMNENNVCMSELPLPGRLGELVGVEVEEYDCLLGNEVWLKFGDEQSGKAEKWSDILTVTTAETVMTYDSEYYRGKTAVSRNHFEKGEAWYVGTDLDETAMDYLIEQILAANQLTGRNTDVVEQTIRRGQKCDYLFVMNHSQEKQQVSVPAEFDQEKELLLAGYEVRILKKEHTVCHE